MRNKTILTLDAGGTNFVFSALSNYQQIAGPLTLPSNGDNLDKCLQTIIDGFQTIKSQISAPIDAISFAFPGPADYEAGIIGDLNNLPGFKGGVALGPMLQRHFGVPVFINNDGDLFALGEALKGFLPYVNNQLEKRGTPKRYKNIFGVTLGTGFGAGIVINGRLITGDNCNGAEIWLMRDGLNCERNVEEAISIRAIKRDYALFASLPLNQVPEPEGIFRIAKGETGGDKEAALKTFESFGRSLGEALANAVTLIDGIIVIGGGLSNAHELFMPAVIEQMNSKYESLNSGELPRLVQDVYPLITKEDFDRFSNFETREIIVPNTNEIIQYVSSKRIGVGLSKLGTSKAVATGAYEFAVLKLSENEN